MKERPLPWHVAGQCKILQGIDVHVYSSCLQLIYLKHFSPIQRTFTGAKEGRDNAKHVVCLKTLDKSYLPRVWKLSYSQKYSHCIFKQRKIVHLLHLSCITQGGNNLHHLSELKQVIQESLMLLLWIQSVFLTSKSFYYVGALACQYVPESKCILMRMEFTNI